MSTDQITITFRCKKCEGILLELPDDYTDDSIAVCKSCRTEFGRFGDIKAKAIEDAKAKMVEDFQKIVRDTFKGNKFITTK